MIDILNFTFSIGGGKSWASRLS